MQSQYLVKKLENLVFYLLIFTIPVQGRVILHRWLPLAPHLRQTGLGAGFNQWASAYLYGTDILLAVIFILWLVRSGVWKLNFQTFGSSTSKLLQNSNFWLVMFFAVSALSIFNSRIIGLSFYQLLKLAEFIGFYFYLKSSIGKIFSFRGVLITVVASGLFQSVVAITQYIKQGSIGLRLLSESPLSVNSTGVAVFFADGVKYLRAYGTTPHPNILAAWLLVAIFAFYYWYFYLASRAETTIGRRSVILTVYAILLLGFFFTFSRVIIGLWLFGIAARFVVGLSKDNFRVSLRRIGSRTRSLIAFTLVVSAIFVFVYWPQVNSRIHISAQEEAVTQRLFYNKIAESTAVSNPLFGVGIGQFVPNFMSKFKHLPAAAFQPVHNIYLLIASETGFVGLSVFVLFLLYVFHDFIRHANFTELRTCSFLIFLFSFLVIGFFDHFLWTSQQGGLMFWMILATAGIPLFASIK